MKFRNHLRIALAAVLLAGATCVAVHAAEKSAPAAAARFEALKKLAGDWVQLGPDGKATGVIASSIRVTAAGSVVQETLFPGSDHEMITMYHLDGADLVLTHYCALGNQPRMKMEAGSDATHLRFHCVSTANLASADDMHMDRATITLRDADHFSAEWSACKDGKPCHTASFELARKK